MKKILSFKKPSMMTTYPYNAYYIGILEGNNKDYYNIIMNDFVDIYYYRQSKQKRIDFINSGTIEYKRFKTKEMILTSKIVSHIKKQINDGYYAIVMLNQKYINNSLVHKEHDFNHDWLIFGYDDSECVFFCYGYFGKNGKQFDSLKLKYDDIVLAMNNVSLSYLNEPPSYFRNHYVKIDLSWVENEPLNSTIEKHLLSVFEHKIKQGNKTYKCVNLYAIKKITDSIKPRKSPQKHTRLLLQNIKTIYDYRSNILLCLKRINIDNKIIKSYMFITKLTYNCLIIAYKYSITFDNNSLKRLYDSMCYLNKSEIIILKEIEQKLLEEKK